MIQYSETLRRKLESSLRSSFDQPNCTVSVPANRGAGFHATMSNGSRTAQMDDGPEQPVAEIVIDGGGTGFWFAFDAAFERNADHQYQLFHVALGVFQDIGGELVPFVRADWHKQDAESTSDHAQPHWHFVQRPARIEGIVRALDAADGEEVQVVDFADEPGLFEGVRNGGLMHFAMTSLWEEKEIPPYRKRLFNSDDFPKWFDNLIRYVAAQVRYVVGHMPTGIHNVLDFNSAEQ